MTVTILPAGTTKLSALKQNNAMMYLADGIIGSGSSISFLEVDGSDIPAVAAGQGTNPYYALMVGLPQQMAQRPIIQGFTLVCTTPRLPFGGLRVSANAPDIRDLAVKGFPGTANTPPGETTQINLWHCNDARLYDIDVDGLGEGALGIGLNICADTILDGVECHDMEHSHGFSAWQCGQTVYNECRAYSNGNGTGGSGGVGFNWEQGTAPEFLSGCASYDNSLGSVRFNGQPPSGSKHLLDGLFVGKAVYAGGASPAQVGFNAILL